MPVSSNVRPHQMPPALWIGRLDNKTLVFDLTAQLPDSPHVFLWNTTSRTMEKYVPKIARSLLKTVRNQDDSATVVAAYEAWRRTDLQNWIEEESKYYSKRREAEERNAGSGAIDQQRLKQLAQSHSETAARRDEARATLVERHREALEAAGGTYLGIRQQSAPRSRRITHCYSCTERLDNSIDIECAACGWILCFCGACGCGYRREA